MFISAASLWEIWLKASLGKLGVPGDFENLPLTSAQTREVATLPWLHRDPFDRMLVAQARTEKLTLLTADNIVAGYGDCVRLVPRGAIEIKQ